MAPSQREKARTHIPIEHPLNAPEESQGPIFTREADTKNPESKTNRLCSRFATTSRIALTGSPLANNVEEYYSTISWVAPNFLGPLSEFREVYVSYIEAGLASESLAWERRKALKILQVLKDTVAPKVNRATIKTCLARDLPPKFPEGKTSKAKAMHCRPDATEKAGQKDKAGDPYPARLLACKSASDT